VSKHLERDLENLQRDVLAMGASVEEVIYKAIRALQERDADLAESVVEGDGSIDELENRIDEECLKILALHQPVATDLRRVAAVLMINTDLERMADLAVDIAERAAVLVAPPRVAIPSELQRMADMTTVMVRDCLNAFVNHDARQARQVIRLDDEVDRLNAAIIREIVGAMQRSPDHVEPNLSLFSAVRHLERIADHATNIAEDVVYLVEGEIVRHRLEKEKEARSAH
jgi:phosphate transport system protein